MMDFIKSRLFWAIFFVVAIGVFSVGLNTNRTFVGETDLLVLPKGERTARNIEQVIGNVKEIPGSLKFYDILLKKNSDIEDFAAGLPDAQRKEMWNRSLKIEQRKNSGVIAVKFFSPFELQAQIVSEQTAKDIINVMSRYYNINTDLEIRLIDGPITKQVDRDFGLGLVGLGLILGLIFGAVVFFVAEKVMEADLTFPRPRISFPTFGANQSRDIAPEAKEVFETPIIKKEKNVGGERKSAAPENLPVGSEFVLSSVKRAEKEMKKAEEVAAEPKTHEATEEEIKQRLNKLLGGKM